MVSFRRFMPQLKPLAMFFLIIFGAAIVAARAGMTHLTAVGVIATLVGLLSRFFKIPMIGKVPMLLEIGLGIVAYQLYTGALTLANLPKVFMSIFTGQPTSQALTPISYANSNAYGV